LSNLLGGADSSLGDEKMWKKLIGEVDNDKDGRINFEEFKQTMLRGVKSNST
jgi:Ca2+-binding EF-hand superfamily protein